MHRPGFIAPSRIRLAVASLFLVAASGCARGGPAFLAPSQPAQFSLAGIPWGSPADSVRSLIEPRGYNFNRIDGDGDFWFDGLLFRAPTRLYAFIGENHLVKIRVRVLTSDEDATSTYQSARAELIKRFGAPKETVERFLAPYKKGDGKEQEAIKAGKAEFRTYWVPGEGARMAYVSVGIGDDLTVIIDYEGPAWNRESLRRRK